ncbi:MAG: hypothetical protein Fur0024_2940 [Patescibacteria group bacterium]
MLPGALVWLTVFLVIFYSNKNPIGVLIFSIIFAGYWAGKSLIIAIGILFSVLKVRSVESIDWEKRGKDLYKNPTRDEKIALARIPKKEQLRFEDIYHIVIHANYREPKEIVIPAIESLANANFNKKKIISVLANEYRNKEVTEENREIFHKKFDKVFLKAISTLHPDKPMEVKAKGANLTYAIGEVLKILNEKKIPFENVVVSALDGDAQVHPEYFNRLTYLFLSTPNRYKKSFQPIPTYLNNIWDAPWFSRTTAFTTSFYFMEECVLSNEYLFTYSGHATSLKKLIEVGFWSVDCINEDSKQFWKMFVHDSGDHEVIPMDLPIYMDAVLADTTRETLINQYKQLQRWAYGAEHLPYILVHMVRNPELRKFKNWKRIFRYFFSNYAWPAAPILSTLAPSLPFLFHPELGSTLFGSSFFFINMIIWSFGYISLFAYFFMSIATSSKFLKERNLKYLNVIYMAIIQWLLYPLTILWIFGLAGFDAMTRLMLGKYLTYWTTEKVRK